jgi:lysophospholipase L1-like esterase
MALDRRPEVAVSVRRVLAVIAVFVAAATLGTAAPAAAQLDASPHYYLSLGDSLAFGYQPDLVAAGDLNAADYRGYAEDFAAMRPHLTLVNYGCPGETSGSMLTGGCPWPGTLHDSYGGAPSQAAAAVAFLRAHPGQVDLISIDLGSNDLLALVDKCKSAPDPRACITAGVPATLATLASNYGTLLAQLRALAPNARIVLFNYYNPLALTLPGSDELAAIASTVVVQLAAHFNATVADAFRAINHEAGSPAETAFVCSRTWECTSFANIHPTDLGYRALAVALLHALD